MARVIAIANQKGGVGKTTTAINLGAALGLAGRQVLAVDLDPQANLTSGLGCKGRASRGATYEALMRPDGSAPSCPRLETPVAGLQLVPADRELTGAELELVGAPDREIRLRRLLDPLRREFDVMLVDTPPSLGLLTLNALVAADALVVPLNCEYFALEGLADLLATLRRVRASFNPALDLAGVLLTMHDERTNLGQQVAREIRTHFGDRVFETVIPRNIRLGEAPSHGLPAVLYDPRSRGAQAYTALARELLARMAVGAGEGHHG
ncbi:MAG TPA: ParA family protein [Vicinamibacterales bacterium]|nr:ParA family protein [Vicinamibacterales bacterium]